MNTHLTKSQAKPMPASVAERGARDGRRAFTLVELLITMLIIAILAAIFLGALSGAEQSARVARTQSLINKLNNMVMARWETYRTVRLPIALDAKAVGGQNALFDASNDMARFRQNVARRRMFALRELVRLEMPDCYDDLDPERFQQSVLIRPEDESPVRTAVWHAYQRRIKSAKGARTRTKDMPLTKFLDEAGATHESAECLYLIVTTNIDSSEVSSEHITPQDWGDTDQDGMPEFLDAWGKPIEFLRWAPGIESALQPIYRYPTNDSTDERWRIFDSKQARDLDDPSQVMSRWNIQIDRVISFEATNMSTSTAAHNRTLVDRTIIVPQEDPFNPMRVGSRPDPVDSNWTESSRWKPGDKPTFEATSLPYPAEAGYALFPFIYSCGIDQRSGIVTASRREGFSYDSSPSDGNPGRSEGIKFSDPYAVYKAPDGKKLYRGAPTGDGSDQDNITNHRIGTN
jgi:prepilin-type N-terminal cleavage/methylation domain-containing protein